MLLRRVPQTVTIALIGLLLLTSCGGTLGKEGQPPDISASSIATLRQSVGREVTVAGTIERTGESSSGFQFLNFADSQLTAVCYPEQLKNFPNGKPADLYRQKNVKLTGKLQLYRGNLQIRLRSPTQIQIVTSPSKKSLPGIKLEKIGKDSWLSPAGLRYRGRDPNGLTHVEHIERHTHDIPARDGPHGVFDGGSAVAFAVIDEAWKLAQQRHLRADREGDRSSYTVDMHRRIGYLGGRTGAAKRHPPLKRVFIVFTSGTHDIITAFPK